MNKITFISSLNLALIIVCASAIALGLIIFFLSGVYRVKENKVMVVEKMDEFYGLYEKGVYFFFPLIYKRRGIYTITNMEKDIRIEGIRTLTVTYKVSDVKKYHYSNLDVEGAIKKAYLNNEEMSEEILRETLENIGVTYISIKAKNE